MKIVVLDGYTENPGDLSWDGLKALGEVTVYAAFRHRVRTFYFPFCMDCWGCEDRETNLCDCFLGEAPTCGACLWSTGKVFCP